MDERHARPRFRRAVADVVSRPRSIERNTRAGASWCFNVDGGDVFDHRGLIKTSGFDVSPYV